MSGQHRDNPELVSADALATVRWGTPLTVSEAAHELGLSARTIRRAIRRGEISATLPLRDPAAALTAYHGIRTSTDEVSGPGSKAPRSPQA